MPDELGTKPPYFGAAQRLWAAALILGFIGIVAWFDGVDFYVRHFFDRGPLVVSTMSSEYFATAVLSWLIYVPGAAVAALIMPPAARRA